MAKWLVTTVIALAVFSGAMPLLRRLGVGRLPGDLNFRIGRWRCSIPIMSTIVLSLIAAGIARLF